MLKSCAVICELNPIHSGHCYVLQTASKKFGEDAVTIAVMSGHFTERCTPAILDKYIRAESAIRAGADLVVELPFPWSSSGVEDFARGGVTVASGMLASSLFFGSESGDAELIKRAAAVKNSDEFEKVVSVIESENRNLGSAVIFDRVMNVLGFPDTFGANDKLGMEYIRHGDNCGITEFYPIKRMKDIPSASDIRRIIFDKGIEFIRGINPEFLYDMLVKNESDICGEERCNELFYNHCRLYLRETDDPLLQYAAKVAGKVSEASEFINVLPTKKYTLARMRREILFSLLKVKKDALEFEPRFTVLLAANKKGRDYLNKNRHDFSIHVITKPADFVMNDDIGIKQYQLHKAADELYALLTNHRAGEFLRRHPIIIR